MRWGEGRERYKGSSIMYQVSPEGLFSPLKIISQDLGRAGLHLFSCKFFIEIKHL